MQTATSELPIVADGDDAIGGDGISVGAAEPPEEVGRMEPKRLKGKPEYKPSYGYRTVDGKENVLCSIGVEKDTGEETVKKLGTDVASLIKERAKTIRAHLAHLAIDASAAGIPLDFGLVELRPVRRPLKGGDGKSFLLSQDVYYYLTGDMHKVERCKEGAAMLGGLMLAEVKGRQYMKKLSKARP